MATLVEEESPAAGDGAIGERLALQTSNELNAVDQIMLVRLHEHLRTSAFKEKADALEVGRFRCILARTRERQDKLAKDTVTIAYRWMGAVYCITTEQAELHNLCRPQRLTPVVTSESTLEVKISNAGAHANCRPRKGYCTKLISTRRFLGSGFPRPVSTAGKVEP